ncbi:MAG: porin family protein [Deltaproteobacteria bacterium]|nr:porin family protein [Deltaproteobacteria bacterium]
MRRLSWAVILMTVLLFAAQAAAESGRGVRSRTSYNWTGFYFGFQGSYMRGTSEWAPEEVPLRLTNNTEGGMGGFYIGYLYQTPVKLVVGFEVDANYGRLSSSSVCPNPSYSCHTEIDWIGSGHGRLGIALGRFLPYVTIGWTYAGADTYVTYEPTRREYGSAGTYLGWTPGVGIEFAASEHLLIRAEYAYYDFGKKNVWIENSDTAVRLENHAFKLGLGLKF